MGFELNSYSVPEDEEVPPICILVTGTLERSVQLKIITINDITGSFVGEFIEITARNIDKIKTF